MSKVKAAKGDAKLSKKESKKATVKEGRVTKPAQTSKAKSKEIAKTVAASHAVREELKKKKKAKKAPTPEPESDSESEPSDSSSEDDSSDSSASSSEDEEVETKAHFKANGVAKPAATADSDNDSSEASSDSSEDDSEDSESESEKEAVAPKANGVKSNTIPKPAAKDKSESEDSDSSSESDSSEDESEGEKPTVKAKVNGAAKVEKAAKANTSSDDDSSDSPDTSDAKSNSASDSDESSDSDDSSASESEKEEAPSKKRKAEPESEPVIKKTKTEDAGEGVKNLFVGNLSWNIDEEWLSREFEGFGEIVGCRIITDRDTGRAKGFGYVEFATADAAKAAQAAMHQTELDGRPLNVDFSTPRQDKGGFKEKTNDRAKRFGDQRSAPSNTLFIGNVSFNATNDMVAEVFGPYGEITRVSLPTDRESGTPKGFGYVDFTSVDEAKAALEALNGTDIAGRVIRIDFASPRDNNGPQRGGFGGRGDRGGRGSRGGFGGRGGRGGPRGGRGGTTNRGGFGDFKGSKVTF
ncbi:RNA-binding domain-containing protein [Zopfia rhizophila CBS 207.26]|uniref:RNA-binding domain-containing protein n=1 Tax=Zopfia rhizophila CBS 207.26 TaxID=1314779 RepID=A0A6A6E529_9PEZI|nr:RNA-binding domain-containing protein [Zopfia rhizophila CBS 207.26]